MSEEPWQDLRFNSRESWYKGFTRLGPAVNIGGKDGKALPKILTIIEYFPRFPTCPFFIGSRNFTAHTLKKMKSSFLFFNFFLPYRFREKLIINSYAWQVTEWWGLQGMDFF